MILVEKHIINGCVELDLLTLKCKKLYNRANYLIRQEFIANKKYLSLYDMCFDMKSDSNFIEIGNARIARGVLRILDANWKSFFATIKDWKSNKSKYKCRPNIPGYLDKGGKFNAIFTDGAFRIKNSKLKLSTLDIEIDFQNKDKKIIEVNIKPLPSGKYQINIAYDHKEEKLKPNNNLYCSIDLGLNNLMTLTSNKHGLKPLLVNGRPLKSINQFYNKKLAKYKSELPKGIYNSKRINKLTEKRNNKINDYLHKSSKFLIDWCLKNNLNTIVIGYNEFWKCEINIGKRNNQNFVQIPFQKLVWFNQYKSRKNGINVKLNDESYTSKCSFLDIEEIHKHKNYLGLRAKRGLFISSIGRKINSDVNGSLNILRKAVPTAFANGIEDIAVYPKRVKSFK